MPDLLSNQSTCNQSDLRRIKHSFRLLISPYRKPISQALATGQWDGVAQGVRRLSCHPLSEAFTDPLEVAAEMR